MITAAPLGHLGSTRLAGHLEILASGFLAQSFTYYHFEYFLNVVQCLRRAYPLFDDLHRELAHDFTILPDSFYKTRTYHLSAVGDGIIESQCGYRRHLGLIPDAHPRQGSLRPIATVFLRAAYPRLSASHQRYIQGNAHSFTIQPIHEFFRMVFIVVVYQAADPDIGRIHQHFRHTDSSVTATPPVVILHHSSVHLPLPVAGVYEIILRNLSVLQRHHDGSGLKSRTGFH